MIIIFIGADLAGDHRDPGQHNVQMSKHYGLYHPASVLEVSTKFRESFHNIRRRPPYQGLLFVASVFILN